MSNRGYYGGGGGGGHPPPHFPHAYQHDVRPNYPVPPQQRTSDASSFFNSPGGYADSQAGLFSGNDPVGNLYHQTSGNYERRRAASIEQPQVIDYANRRANTNQQNLYDQGKGDYSESFSEPSRASSTPQAAPAPFSGALSKISLTELKNTLGGQLGNILSKSITQPSIPPDAQATDNRPANQDFSQTQRDVPYSLNSGDTLPKESHRDRVYEGSSSQVYGGDRREYFNPSAGTRSYDNDGGGGRRYGLESNFSEQPEVEPQKKPLFPIASASEEKPRSILKKSILKKSEPERDEQRSQFGRSSNDVVDEDDFLYGGGVPPPERKSEIPLAKTEEVPVTKPDTQKIISNPAFTALLKSIGLDDINMAERVKEKQQAEKQQAERLKAEKQSSQPQGSARRQSSISKEEGFGIDQTASFLSSGRVVLDDLLKLKQPQRDLTPQSSHGSKYSDDFDARNADKQSKEDHEVSRKRTSTDGYDKSNYRSDAKPADRERREDRRGDDKSERGRSDRRREDDSYRTSGKAGEKSSRRRSRSPGSRRSPVARRRSRSPAGRRRSRSPPGKRRSPGRKERSRTPDRKSRGEIGKDKTKGQSPPRQVSPFLEDNARKRASRWTELSPKVKEPSPVRASSQNEEKRRNLSIDRQLEAIPRKRVLEDTEPSPPPKSTKQEEPEDTGIHDLLSRIPRDVKLTRVQFEELLKAHQAKQAAYSKEKEIMAQVSPLQPVKKRELSPEKATTTTSRKVIAKSGEDDFKNLKMVVRSDSSKPKTKTVTDDDLLDIKPKRSESPMAAKEEGSEGRRVVRRIGAMGNATLEKHVIESDKEKYLREFEKSEWQKAFGDEPLLPKLSRHEIANIRQIIQFNREKLLKAEQQLEVLQEGQSDVMKNKRYASMGEQYHLDKTLEQNIRLQNDLTADIKQLKKLVRDDDLTLDEQHEQEKKIREIARRKAAAAKAVDAAHSIPAKEESPPPEKQDRKYRRAMEDKMMAKSAAAAAIDVKPSEVEAKQPVSKPGTTSIEYYDPGAHWCKSCNFVGFKLYGYLEHLQTNSHMKRREKIGKPWQPAEVFNPPRKSLISRQETVVHPMKGIEFVHPVDAFYCVLCNYFTGDKDSIEYHIKSDEHSKQYAVYLTDNPMYEKRYKMDKEAGLVVAKKLEEKRKEEQDRVREAEREEEERRRDGERRKEAKKREAEELRKKEKLEKLKARKKAEVLAITRGAGGDSDVELVDEDEQTTPAPPVNETPQERIKRELLEKTRAKKAGVTEEPGVADLESAVKRSIKQAKDTAKTVQQKVKAKAQEIEESVYGPKQVTDSLDTSGIFLPPAVIKPKVTIGKMPSKKAAESSSAEKKATSQSTTSTAPTTNTISPFVRKMMEMEKTGEIITTATVKAQQVAAAAPRPMQPNPRFGVAPTGPMAMTARMRQMNPPNVIRTSAPNQTHPPTSMGPQLSMGPPQTAGMRPLSAGMRPTVTTIGARATLRPSNAMAPAARAPQTTSGPSVSIGPGGIVRPSVSIGLGGIVRPQVSIGPGGIVTPQVSIGQGGMVRPQGSIGPGSMARPQGSIGPGGMVRPQGSIGPGGMVRQQATIGPGGMVRQQATIGPGRIVRPQVTIGPGGIVIPQVSMGPPVSMASPDAMSPRGPPGFGSGSVPMQMRPRGSHMITTNAAAPNIHRAVRPAVRANQKVSSPSDDLRPPGTGPQETISGVKKLGTGSSPAAAKDESSEESSSSSDEGEGEGEDGNGAGHSFSLAGLLSQFSEGTKKETDPSTETVSTTVAKSAQQSSVGSSMKKSDAVEVSSISSTDALKQSNEQQADSTTAVDTLPAEGDVEEMEDMMFTVIDSVGDEENQA